MSTSSVKSAYHHGDLRCALMEQALITLEGSAPLSLRGLAKATGVSPTAVYRHFSDKRELESALAAEGYRDLLSSLEVALANIDNSEKAWKLAAVYVNWAQTHRAVFNLMFTTDCDPNSPERVEAVVKLQAFISEQLKTWYPKRFNTGFVLAVWSLVHGLTTLILEGKISDTEPNGQEEQIRKIWQATFG